MIYHTLANSYIIICTIDLYNIIIPSLRLVKIGIILIALALHCMHHFFPLEYLGGHSLSSQQSIDNNELIKLIDKKFANINIQQKFFVIYLWVVLHFNFTWRAIFSLSY